MKRLLAIGLRVVIYFFILLPILRGIFSGLGWFAIIPAFIVLLLIVSIVEARKLMSRLVDFVAGLLGAAIEVTATTDSTESSGIIDSFVPTIKVECSSCGFQSELRGGKGQCEACGTAIG